MHSEKRFVSVSFTLEVEFEFTTWAWVQATAETAFGSGLVVRSPGSVKALNQSTHNSLGHCWNVHSAVAGHGRMNFRQWPATAKWTFRQWPRELWVDWFNALIEPGDRTTRPPQNAVSAVAWTQAQVVNSNSTSAVQDPILSVARAISYEIRARKNVTRPKHCDTGIAGSKHYFVPVTVPHN